MTIVPFVRKDRFGFDKKFAWSYSALKSFETCPRRYYETKIAKDYKDETSEAGNTGLETHRVLAEYLLKKKPLPVTLHRQQAEADKLIDKAKAMGGRMRVEWKLAIDNQFRPVEWGDGAAWFRGVADAVIIKPPFAVVYDWKTGKFEEDIPQLALTAQLILSNVPDIKMVGTEFIWLKQYPTVYTAKMFDKEQLLKFWNDMWPRVTHMLQAYETNVYPEKTSGLCQAHCPVLTCRHNGRRG